MKRAYRARFVSAADAINNSCYQCISYRKVAVVARGAIFKVATMLTIKSVTNLEPSYHNTEGAVAATPSREGANHKLCHKP